MSIKTPISVFWFRRDLRLNDNKGLFYALQNDSNILPIFIFDKKILKQFEQGENAQVELILNEIISLKNALSKVNSTIKVFYSTPLEVFEQLADEYNIKSVYTNEDYELQAINRDKEISDFLVTKGVQFKTYKDHVIFSKNDILKDDNSPYTVFTPYSKKWKEKLTQNDLKEFESEKLLSNLYQFTDNYIPSLSELGFKHRNIEVPSIKIVDSIIATYDKTRDYPAIEGTTKLAIHLRFGTLSIRKLAKKAIELNAIYLNELIWRDFYQSITYHFPHICEGKAFKAKYDNVAWQNNEHKFDAWCNGQTGYPLVDAGMRELNTTGFMHNRVRMVTASFLIKHLLIDWRWGEAYFANKLIDFDFAANNGGWQWAASSGCDAAPYFRIFNPELQAAKFDKNNVYIQKWIPEYGTINYPKPIVDHKEARLKAIDLYTKALKE